MFSSAATGDDLPLQGPRQLFFTARGRRDRRRRGLDLRDPAAGRRGNQGPSGLLSRQGRDRARDELSRPCRNRSGIQIRARPSARAARRLCRRQGRLPLAQARALQLGARLVRRRARRGRRGREDGARRSSASGAETLDLRRAVRALLAARQRPARARRQARRPHPADARQCAPLWKTMLAAMKLGARRHPRDAAARGADIADRLARGRARFIVADGADAGEIRRARRRRSRASRSARRPRAGATTRRCSPPSPHFAPDGPTARRRSDAALFHVRHDGEARSSWCTATRAIPSAISRRCTGSACGPATSTSISPRPAGRSTPGRASSRRGTPAPWSSRSARRFDARATLDALVAHRSDDVLRAADGLAHARSRRLADWQVGAARGQFVAASRSTRR